MFYDINQVLLALLANDSIMICEKTRSLGFHSAATFIKLKQNMQLHKLNPKLNTKN